ncbi:endonuclease/exonuclease/phosphatase family protein [Actinophytocola sp. S1-96]|uniref:Endonuclease/exonuclease/phosphatase family protein n=2 Tax=Actinophytocola gossypii TaxID=2812003 RepID=A0ABT2J452_9PSEU|nr:endonuclease/exonuclease/phosphatase family protein [Actinophytocola gossypii]
MAVSPYVAGFGLVWGLLALLLRRRLAAGLVLLLSVALGSLLAPRVLSDTQPGADGERLRIMAVNLYLGSADPHTVVDLVRSQQVDVLVLPELTQDAADDLDRAGLRDLLPEQVYDVGVGGEGTGIAASLPLRQIVLMDETTLSQPSVVVDLDGREDVELTAVHTMPGVRANSAGTWHDELAALPHPTPDERIRVLAGDFNATFDHAAFRDVVDRGYADAAEETGQALTPTWSSMPTGPPVTIDHILVDRRCAIGSYAVFDVPGTDHDAVLAEIVLP